MAGQAHQSGRTDVLFHAAHAAHSTSDHRRDPCGRLPGMGLSLSGGSHCRVGRIQLPRRPQQQMGLLVRHSCQRARRCGVCALLAATFYSCVRRSRSATKESLADLDRWVGGVAGAAVWFVFLQFFALQTICPYCMAAHGCVLARQSHSGERDRFVKRQRRRRSRPNLCLCGLGWPFNCTSERRPLSQ